MEFGNVKEASPQTVQRHKLSVFPYRGWSECQLRSYDYSCHYVTNTIIPLAVRKGVHPGGFPEVLSVVTQTIEHKILKPVSLSVTCHRKASRVIQVNLTYFPVSWDVLAIHMCIVRSKEEGDGVRTLLADFSFQNTFCVQFKLCCPEV